MARGAYRYVGLSHNRGIPIKSAVGGFCRHAPTALKPDSLSQLGQCSDFMILLHNPGSVPSEQLCKELAYRPHQARCIGSVSLPVTPILAKL